MGGGNTQHIPIKHLGTQHFRDDPVLLQNATSPYEKETLTLDPVIDVAQIHPLLARVAVRNAIS